MGVIWDERILRRVQKVNLSVLAAVHIPWLLRTRSIFTMKMRVIIKIEKK